MRNEYGREALTGKGRGRPSEKQLRMNEEAAEYVNGERREEMEELKQAIAHADDDYLVGISNKGIVKRAYKDLSAADVRSGFIDTTADITVDNTQCVLRVPLVKSSCACPSRTICRHIVTAILWLRQEWGTGTTSDAAETVSSKQEATAVSAEKPVTAGTKQETNGTVPVKEDRFSSEGTGVSAAPPAPLSKAEQLAQELSAVPLDKLQKAMKKQYYTAFWEKAKAGVLPVMDGSTVITADILEENVTVKLLSPLGYSACTCHSKELCRHKAAVIAAWQLTHGVLTLAQLSPPEEKTAVTDTERLRRCLTQGIDFLEGIFSHGLVRMAEEADETSETLAVLCHSAEFPEGERLFRELGNRLGAYTAHSPEFDTDRLFALMMHTYRLLTRLQQETDPQQLQTLAGTFRDSYHVTEAMTLVPLAQQPFTSLTGYQGTVYYFLNKGENRTALPYVTFSDIRPTMYENSRSSARANAPWGLYGPCSILMQSELRLLLPKVSGIRLSSSNETKAMQLSRPNLNQPAVYDRIYTDFRRLIEEHFGGEPTDGENLVMLLPERCISSSFREITQTHTIVAEDAYGQRLAIEARYHSQRQAFFDQLALVGQQMQQHPEKPYVIFGNAAIKDGVCRIYPIAVFDTITPPRPIVPKDTPHRGDPSCRYFLSLFREYREQLCDMIQCGLHTFTLYDSLRDSAEECEQSGLTFLAEQFRQLADDLSAQNHTYQRDSTAIIHRLSRMDTYLQTGIRLTEIGCAIDALYPHEEDSVWQCTDT